MEHICKTQHEEGIQRSCSSLPLIQAQLSEADEHLSYLDPQDPGLPIPHSDYPIGEEEEVEQFSLYTPAHPTFQSLPPPPTLPAISYTGPTPGTSTGTGTRTGSGSGTGVTTAIQAAINAAIAALPQGQGQNNGKNYKLLDQANFSGHAENVESFLLECTM